MAYIGKTPVIGNFQVCDAISVVNNQAAYTMQVGGVNVSPETANHMLVSLNGILQAPTSSFTVSGSTITFASNLVTGDVIDFIQILGNVLDLGVPSDNTVTTAKLSDSSVSLAKLTATGTKDATTFLRGDNTFAGAGITMADQWRITATKTVSSSASDITANWERIDSTGQGTLGTGMTESSGVFSFPSTGIYYVALNLAFYTSSAESRYIETQIRVTTDNSSYNYVSRLNTSVSYINSSNTYANSSQATLIDVTNISNVKVMFRVQSENGTTISGSTDHNEGNMFTFIRLGDT
jgi:hypothetical protein